MCTRARGTRQGVRWLTGGLKVYYLALMPMPDVFSSGRVSLPTLFRLLVRERCAPAPQRRASRVCSCGTRCSGRKLLGSTHMAA